MNKFVQAIENRHSVRKFLNQAIPQDAIARLQIEIKKINKESGLNFQFVVNEPQAFGGFMAHYGKFENVNNYFALIGKKNDPKLDEKIGYYGERLVVLAGVLNIETCWVALTYTKSKCKAKPKSDEKLVCVIAVGEGGTNQGVPHKSKDVSKVSDLKETDPEWYKQGVRLALLAPTAMNQQKFYISRNDNKVNIQAKWGPYSKVDLGIVKYHFEVGAGQENFVWEE